MPGYTDTFKAQLLDSAHSFVDDAAQATAALEASFDFGPGESQQAAQALAQATQFFLSATQRSAALLASCRQLDIAFDYLNSPELSDGSSSPTDSAPPTLTLCS